MLKFVSVPHCSFNIIVLASTLCCCREIDLTFIVIAIQMVGGGGCGAFTTITYPDGLVDAKFSTSLQVPFHTYNR